MPPNVTAPALAATNTSWCGGWMNPGNLFLFLDGSAATNSDFFMHALVGRYSGAPKIYKCPSDKFIFPSPRITQTYVRSVALNIYIGGTLGAAAAAASPVQPYRRFSEVARPANLFSFIHEDPNTIDEGVFSSPIVAAGLPGTLAFGNRPAALHGGATSIGFMDGHAEHRRWSLLTMNNGVPIATSTASNPEDAIWLKQRTHDGFVQ